MRLLLTLPAYAADTTRLLSAAASRLMLQEPRT
jgi:hypothetical protein